MGTIIRIDDLMNQFRLASRELFNHYFRVTDPYDNDGWQSLERFGEVQSLLFHKMVAEPASLSKITYGGPQTEILVELRDTESAPIMLNRETSSGYWDFPLAEVTTNARLVFISFFDWDQLDYRDNHYVRVLVSSWPSYPETIGKHALIRSTHVRFVRTT